MSSLDYSSPGTISPLPGHVDRHGEAPGFMGLPWTTWLKVAVIGLAFVVLYRWNLLRLWEMTNPFTGDDNWKHAAVVPVIGLYYLFLRRDELAATPVEPLLAGRFTRARVISAIALVVVGLGLGLVGYRAIPEREGMWIIRGLVENGGYGLAIFGGLVLLLDWGLAALIGGLFITGYGIWPARNNFVWDFGMILTLFGIVLTMCGWRIMRIAWFPIVFLVCALPWPPIVYSQVAMPLQALAARVSVTMLQVTGIDASFAETKIFIPQVDANGVPLPDRTLNVAEACAGLRSLMSFISIAAAIAFLSARPMWQKLVITFSAIPIAIFCNVMRVAGQGMLDHYVGRQWSEGFAHHFAGMVMMLPAFLLILLVCWIVDQLFIEEAPETVVESNRPTGSPAGGAA